MKTLYWMLNIKMEFLVMSQSEELFDLRLVDTDVQSYCGVTPLAVLSSAEAKEKRKYLQACQAQRGTFTPLCMSIDGMMGREATVFFRQLADLLSAKWDKDYGSVMSWVCTRLSFAILHATFLCIHGS